MGVLGYAQGAAWEPLGSELVADVAAGSLVLPLEWVGQFDDDGGALDLNGTTYTYSDGAIDEDAETITLDSVTLADATEGDAVTAVSGGAIRSDLVLHVSVGDGDDVEVVVPYRDRDLWPEGEYADPVQVLLSDDMETILDVPGRTPVRDGAFVEDPFVSAALISAAALPDATWTTLTGWFTLDLATSDLTYNGGTGQFTIGVTGTYLIVFGITFDTNSSGSRAIRLQYDTYGGVYVSRMVKVPPNGTTGFDTTHIKRFQAGERVSFQAFQNSGGVLDALGSIGLQHNTTVSILRVVGEL